MIGRTPSLDPQACALLDRLGSGPGDEWRPPSLREMREPFEPGDATQLPTRQVADVVDLLVPAEAPVRIRAFLPSIPAPRATLVWLHPGGFVSGSIDDVDGVCRALANEGGITVIAVGYRLAPEHPYPAALDDVHAAFAWLHRHARTLGLDGDCLAIGGQSAGANLAAGYCLRAREEHAPQPALQVLAYPVLDPALDSPSAVENDGFLFTTSELRWCWEQYLGASGPAPPPPTAAPLHAAELSGLPPALILAAGYDPARDDSRSYARRLIWRTDCQGGRHDFSLSRVGFEGCGWLGGWRSGLLCATRGQTDIRGFGPQDHGSSWGAAI